MEITSKKSAHLAYKRNGLILRTDQYQANVNFYSRILELPILFVLDNDHSKLTCLKLGGNYLMIEPCATMIPNSQTRRQNPVCIRFNVEDVEATAAELANRGVNATIRNEVWGTVGDFKEPDGNRRSLRDERTFMQQISNEA